MRLQPIGRSLVVQIKHAEKKGLLILARQDDEPRQARVMGVGDKVEAPIKVGDLVLLAPYSGNKIAGGNEDEPYMLIGEKEILGILRDE
jgi:co-chaperonin GroES (HSP10)